MKGFLTTEQLADEQRDALRLKAVRKHAFDKGVADILYDAAKYLISAGYDPEYISWVDKSEDYYPEWRSFGDGYVSIRNFAHDNEKRVTDKEFAQFLRVMKKFPYSYEYAGCVVKKRIKS